mmetsp:Transcript_141723/g.344269  ORF Transcript_141723/g.344269 Transcript_141723/m.344269 type:complete len:273 (+) Transcript_141723:163-981(+)
MVDHRKARPSSNRRLARPLEPLRRLPHVVLVRAARRVHHSVHNFAARPLDSVLRVVWPVLVLCLEHLGPRQALAPRADQHSGVGVCLDRVRLAVLPPGDAARRHRAQEAVSRSVSLVHWTQHAHGRPHDHGLVARSETLVFVPKLLVLLGLLDAAVNLCCNAAADAAEAHQDEGHQSTKLKGRRLIHPWAQLIHLREREEEIGAADSWPRQVELAGIGDWMPTEKLFAEVLSFHPGDEHGQRAGPVVRPKAGAHQVIAMSIDTRGAKLARRW